MHNEVQISDLLLGDIQSTEIKGLRSFEWKIGGIYKTGLELYQAIFANRYSVRRADIKRFKKQVHRHRSWMNRRVFSLLAQSEIIRNDVVIEYRDFRAESVALYQQVWEVFDALLSPEAMPTEDDVNGILKINQLLDAQNRRDQAFVSPLLAALQDSVEPSLEGYADAA